MHIIDADDLCGLRPDVEALIQLLSLVHSKHLRTLVLAVPLYDLRMNVEEVRFDNPQWKVLDELLCDVDRFPVLGMVMVVMDCLDVEYLLKGSDSAPCRTDISVHTAKTAFKLLISERRLQLVLRSVSLQFQSL